MLHFLILSALAAAVFLFASNKAALNADFTRILHDLQGGVGGPMASSRQGVVRDLQRLFAVSIRNLYLVGRYRRLRGSWRESRRSGCGSAATGPSTSR